MAVGRDANQKLPPQTGTDANRTPALPSHVAPSCALPLSALLSCASPSCAIPTSPADSPANSPGNRR